jgi:hypothetical protein
MQFTLKANQTLEIDPPMTWIIYSKQTRSFIVGDEKKAFALSLDRLGPAIELPPETVVDSCNLPISGALYDEFRRQPWHGLQFLERATYQQAPDGNLLCTLIDMPDYGQCVLHPATGALLRMRSGSIEIVGGDFKSIEKTRTRGRAALAFAAHPTEGLIAYGDNYGMFHAQRFDAGAFGKASKIATKERKASRLEFVKDGATLVIGGMGYLQTYSYVGGKFAPIHETSIAVRDFLWLNNGELILVNQGLHGITALRYDDKGFSKIGDAKPPGAVQQMTASANAKFVAVSEQESAAICVYELSA